MKRATEDRTPDTERPDAPVHGAVVARLVAAGRDGVVTVTLPGRAPTSARLLASVPRALLERSTSGRELLVVCEGGDPSRPIVVGLMEDPAEAVLALVDGSETIAPQGDAEHKVFSAEGSITLVCGEASLTLHADGRVVTRGVNVVSVASEQQRIQGSVVRIN